MKHSWYGNHNKRKGDIVQVARWEEKLLKKLSNFYGVELHKIDEVKFIIVDIRYNMKKICIVPKNPSITQNMAFIDMDEASLIRVGRLE